MKESNQRTYDFNASTTQNESEKLAFAVPHANAISTSSNSNRGRKKSKLFECHTLCQDFSCIFC